MWTACGIGFPNWAVDGFRFDLATVLQRDRAGNLQASSPLVNRISEDPVLRSAKLIAEPWDLAGGDQLGRFGGARWREWNGRYRDGVRRFWRGDGEQRNEFALRVGGSPDFYDGSGRGPFSSINYVTAHDGFTLHDLVTYTEKRNLANGEDNRDGAEDDYAFNCGVEGETDDPAVHALRLRLAKSHLATLFLSMGTPMLLGGDEFGRTQLGNNNAYCQDGPLAWYDWSLLDRNQELFAFCRRIIAFRKAHAVFARPAYLPGALLGEKENASLTWHEPDGAAADWGSGERALACRIAGGVNGGVALWFLFNPADEPRMFRVPPGAWRVRVDTAASPPEDIVDESAARSVAGGDIEVGEKGVIVLAGHGGP